MRVCVCERLYGGTKRRGISGCSFCKYLKSRRVEAARRRTPPQWNFQYWWLEIVLINETTWPFETLFATAYTTDTCTRAALCYIIYVTDDDRFPPCDTLTDILRLIGSLCLSRDVDPNCRGYVRSLLRSLATFRLVV